VVPLDFPALDTLRVDSLHAASALAVTVVFSFIFNDPLTSLCSTSFSLPFFPLLLPYRLPDLKNVPTLLCLFLIRFLPLFLSLLHFLGADDALVDALLHRSPLSPFLLACNKKRSSRAITFSYPSPQRSLKSILIFSDVYFCPKKSQTKSLFFRFCTSPESEASTVYHALLLFTPTFGFSIGC
jgi:hypothetical protein